MPRTIYTVYEIQAEPDKHDVWDSYGEMPSLAFTSLKKAIAFTHASWTSDHDDVYSVEGEYTKEELEAIEKPMTLKELTAKAKAHFAAEPTHTLHVKAESLGHEYLISPMQLS